MPTYTSLPATIEAIQFVPSENNLAEYEDFEPSPELWLRQSTGAPIGADLYQLWVQKSGAWCDINIGDYIIKEPDGSGLYPCAQAIFESRWTADRG